MIFPFIFQLQPYEQQRPCRLPYLGLCDCCYSVLWQSTNYHLCSIMLCWWNTFCTLRKCYTKKIGDDCKNKHWRTNSTLSSRWWWRKNLILNSLDISWFSPSRSSLILISPQPLCDVFYSQAFGARLSLWELQWFLLFLVCVA